MNGKENIINKILSDADETCARIISNAENLAEATVNAARDAVKSDRVALDGKLATVRDERIRNARANAELEAKKYRLRAKQTLVERCYDEVYKHLVGLNDEDRLDFIGELIEKYAEDGETVYVTERDGKNVTPLWLKGFEKHLKLGGKYLRADGGILLEGEGYEKNLTVARVVELLKEQTLSQVATALGVRNE